MHENSRGKKITRIHAGSIAEKLGAHVGDYLISINGHEVTDVLDVWFRGAARRIKLEIARGGAGGPRETLNARKAYHEHLGIELEPLTVRRCTNACVFCFVHQLPRGMRRELYIKDEDYRLSFLHGNYITGTNLSEEDKRRIVEMKLSPLYMSVHATDEAVRQKLLARRKIEPILPLMKWLADHGICQHAQIVLCPGWNDGEVLERTADDLASLYPKLESVAVVPVGLTEHRTHLPNIHEITPEYAKRFLAECAVLQKRLIAKIGYPLLFPGDEFYIIAGHTPPSYARYTELPQLANGVGMYYRFYQHLSSLTKRLPTRLPQPRRVAAITAKLGGVVLRRLVDDLNARIENLHLELLVTTNTVFGEGITVSGLIPGCDFHRTIAENHGFDRYLIPQNALRPWDERFLDDVTLEHLRASTSAEIAVGSDTAESFVAAAIDEVPVTPEHAAQR